MRKKLMVAMLAVMSITLCMFFASFASASAAESAPLGGNYLTASVTEDIMTVTVEGSPAGDYKYWLRELVETDEIETNQNSEQYMWVKQSGESFTVDANADVFDVLVQVKSGAETIGTLYGTFARAEVGLPVINTVKIDGVEGQAVFKVGASMDVEVYAQNADAGDIKIDLGEGGLAIGTVDLSGYERGYYNAVITAANGNGSDTRKIKVYIAGAFDGETAPAIDSLTAGVKVGNMVTFTMAVTNAAENAIAFTEADNYNAKLSANGVPAINGTAKDDGGNLAFEFVMQFPGSGIYEMSGTVARAGVSGADDKIIQYYYGFKDNTVNIDTFTQSNDNYTVTAANADLYALYREDASGWVMVAGWQDTGTFEWSPKLNGIYNLQARVKKSDSASYEAAYSMQVGEAGLEQSALTVTAEAEDNGKYFAGKAYEIKANYTGADVLYKFTLSNKNIGLEYLTAYSFDGSYIFVPTKADAYTVTVRALSVNNYGALDVAKSVDINAVVFKTTNIDEEVLYSAMDGKIIGLNDILGGGQILSATQGANNLTVAGNSITGLNMNSGNVITITEITLNTANESYNLTNVKAYTKILTDKSDLAVFDIHAGVTQSLTGYYLLANDIDASGVSDNRILHGKYSAGSAGNPNGIGFAGVFDGGGHTLKVKTGTFGLFAYFGDSAEIKNVAVEADVENTTSNNGNNVLSVLSAGTTTGANVNIENVYVKVSSFTNSTRNVSLIRQRVATMTMKNVIVENGFYDETKAGGVMFFEDAARYALSAHTNKFIDVYVIAAEGAYITCWSTPPTTNNIVAANDVFDTSASLFQYDNIKRYLTLNALFATQGAANLPWELNGGVLTWKN